MKPTKEVIEELPRQYCNEEIRDWWYSIMDTPDLKESDRVRLEQIIYRIVTQREKEVREEYRTSILPALGKTIQQETIAALMLEEVEVRTESGADGMSSWNVPNYRDVGYNDAVADIKAKRDALLN